MNIFRLKIHCLAQNEWCFTSKGAIFTVIELRGKLPYNTPAYKLGVNAYLKQYPFCVNVKISS